jgi:hypothetical protein
MNEESIEARAWMTGMALNGLLHSASYGAELRRVFDRQSAIANTGDDGETPQQYTARIAISLADAVCEALQKP